MKIFPYLFLVILVVFMAACETQEPFDSSDIPSQELGHEVLHRAFPGKNAPVSVNSNPGARISGQNEGLYLTVSSASYITDGLSGKMGKTLIFRDTGNKQLEDDFAPGLSLDESDNISFYVERKRPASTITTLESEPILTKVFDTWAALPCSDPGLNKVYYNGNNYGFIPFIFGFGGSLDYVADIYQGGWLPKSFFDIFVPGGGNFILGVTFTIIFTDADGNPIDTNNDGKQDVAWREIYYNNAFNWQLGSFFDLETIALHETGHGLSQAHFGKGFFTKKGQLKLAPAAVMNATYTAKRTRLAGTDKGGHCSNWANWPK